MSPRFSSGFAGHKIRAYVQPDPSRFLLSTVTVLLLAGPANLPAFSGIVIALGLLSVW